MHKALQEARQAAEEGEIPVGAVVVCKGKIIARAHNETEKLNDVTAHAEMLAITMATSYLGGKYLNECTLYVTMEPCTMCAGALSWAQLGELIPDVSGLQEQMPWPCDDRDKSQSGDMAAPRSVPLPKSRLHLLQLSTDNPICPIPLSAPGSDRFL